ALQPHAFDDSGVQAGCADTPVEFGKLDMVGQQQRRLAGVVAVAALLDTAGPSAMEVSRDPAAFTRRGVQAEVRPGMTAPRVFEDAAPAANRGECSSEAAAIVALDLALTGALDVERLAGPEFTPALAGAVGDDRMRT